MGVDEKKWEDHSSCDVEEEETLSLCDLPVDVLEVDDQDRGETQPLEGEVENFEFGPSVGSFRMELEMCVADDVFFQGQILPLRLSVSSDNGLLMSRCFKNRLSTSRSRSESMDHSSSNRSSTSSRSHHSSNTTTTTTTTATYEPKIRNPFHSYPSPNPRIRFSGSKLGNVTTGRSRRSTLQGIFRLGLVHTPAMELQELRLRNNSTSTRSTSSSSGSGDVMFERKRKKKKNNKTQRFLFESCKCSMSAIETVSSKIVVIKSGKKETKMSGTGNKDEEREKTKVMKQGKNEMYHRRTFEWLKELSIADVPIVI